MKPLNLTHDKLEAFPVELDEFGLLHVLSPTKGLFEELARVIPATQGLAGAKLAPDKAAAALNAVYEVCAHLLSRNTERKEITPEDVERVLDVSDLIVFIKAYVEFITERTDTNAKN